MVVASTFSTAFADEEEPFAVQPIGQCNPGTPDIVFMYPTDWPADSFDRANLSELARRFDEGVANGRLEIGDRVYHFAHRPDIADGEARFLSAETSPQPDFPAEAAMRGLQGSCDVYFEVSVDGTPDNVTAACSDPIFIAPAEAAVSKTRLRPFVVTGIAITRFDVIVPINFCLN